MDISRAEQRILHLLAQGGRIELTRDEDRKIEKIQLFTREGWVFSGLDVIGDCLTEINVTSPTGFQEITAQTGHDVAAQFIAAIERA